MQGTELMKTDNKVIHVAVLRNPFDISQRYIFDVTLPEDTVSLERFIIEHVETREGLEFHASINGRVFAPEELGLQLLNNNDYVAVCPVIAGGGSGKNPLALLAGLALAFFAFGVVAPGVTGLFGGKAVAGAVIAGKIAAGLTLMIGGQLISNAFMPKMKQEKDTQSYGWGALQSIQGQGAVIPITYGTIKTAGQVLSQHVHMKDDMQYLKVIMCGGEGPIEKFTNIKINDNDIANFQDVEYWTRSGTNDQTEIAGFDELYSDQFFNYVLAPHRNNDGSYDPNLPGEWIAQAVNGDASEGLEVDISFQGGLFNTNKKGDLEDTWVHIDVEYGLEISGDVPSWSKFNIPNDGEIRDKKNKPFTRVYRADHLTPGQYHVRARCRRKPFEGSNKGANQVAWTKLTSVIYQPMSRPNKALLAISMRASEQLSGGMPNITWEQTRNKVWVFDNGMWVQKDAQNPAWVVYDLCVKCRQLHNEMHVFGVSPDRIDLDQFKGWAKFCDRKINGKTAIRINLLVDSAKQLWEWIQSIATSARGSIVLKGTRISCVWDTVSTPVQLFSVGNVLKDSFSMDYLPMESRANAVEISFRNAAKDYEQEQITVYANEYDLLTEKSNPVSVELTGVTDFEMAYREGMYRLFMNKLLRRTITFQADVDAIACQVGDVIRFQHDVPVWGQGGRILAVNGTTLTLDNYLERKSGAKMYLRKQDDSIVERTVTFLGAGEYTDKVSIGDSNVTPGDVFAITTSDSPIQLFRILAIGRNADSHVTLNCIEYDEQVYSDNFVIPDYDGGGGGGIRRNMIVGLGFHGQGSYDKSGQWVSQLWAAWSYTGEVPINYELAWAQDQAQWESPGTVSEPTAMCPILRDINSEYQIRVRAIYAQSPPSEWAFASSKGIILGDGFPPDPPTNLEAQGWAGFAVLTWVNPENRDLSHIEVWESLEDDIATAKQIGQTAGTTYTRLVSAGGNFYYWVRAVSYTGLKSDWNAKEGTYCEIQPQSWDAIIDEILKRPWVQEAIKELTGRIDEVESLANKLAEDVIDNSMRDYRETVEDKLIERLNDKIAEGLIDQSLVEDANYKHSLALIIDEKTTRESEGEAFAQKVDGVVAMIGDPRNPGPDTVYGAVLDTKTAMATADEALAQRTNEVISMIGDPLHPSEGSVYGAIRTEERTRATADEAQAQRVDTIAAIMGNPADPKPGTAFGAIREESTVRANADEAEAAQRKQLEATMHTADGKNTAAILEEKQNRVTADSALSSNVTTVQTQVNENTASIQELSRSVDGISTMWGVKLDVNGYITGLIMNNQGEGKSSTVFHTDTFLVGKPGVNGGDPKYAFVIAEVNGVYRVAMDNAFIQDLAVDTLKIRGRAVTIPGAIRTWNRWGSNNSTNYTYFPDSDMYLTDCMKDQPTIIWIRWSLPYLIQGGRTGGPGDVSISYFKLRIGVSISGQFQEHVVFSDQRLVNEARYWSEYMDMAVIYPKKSGDMHLWIEFVAGGHGDFGAKSNPADYLGNVILCGMHCKR